MTEHVRTSYRHHRRATWGLATVLVLAIAAVAIPIASGAPDKTYKLEFPATAPVTPVLLPPGNTLSQTLCTDTTYTSVKLTVSNTAPNATLGSADVTFPSSRVTLTGASIVPPAPNGAATITQSGDVVRLRNLALPKKTGSVTFTVSLNTNGKSPGGPSDIIAMVKQSNDFSDAGQNPDANAFDPPTAGFPKITLQTCNATISGRVYHDRDQSGIFSVDNPNSATSDLVKPNWTVTLLKQTGATYTNVDSAVSDANGLYEVEGPAGSNYRVCVRAVTPPASSADSAGAWAVRSIPNVTLTTGCTDITASSPDSSGLSVQNLPAAGVTNQNFAVVPVTVFNFGAGNTAGENTSYVVRAASNSDKDPQHYVKESWTDSSGRPYFVFAPINACLSACVGKIFLLEDMSGSISQSDLGTNKQVVLVYDDTEPFNSFRAMPYCLRDPRHGVNLLHESDVLPPPVGTELPHTSCIVEGHQEVDGDGSVTNAEIDFRFLVYTSHDGSRGFS